MRPSIAFNTHRQAIRDVFGSVLRGTDRDGGDLDIVVDPSPTTSLFDLGGMQDALEQLLSVPIDLVTPTGLRESMRESVLAEAEPI